MKALEAYQRKHNLGVGGVTRETLQAMGIEQ
jgi:lipoprotein